MNMLVTYNKAGWRRHTYTIYHTFYYIQFYDKPPNIIMETCKSKHMNVLSQHILKHSSDGFNVTYYCKFITQQYECNIKISPNI
jgi:hypothetical protein